MSCQVNRRSHVVSGHRIQHLLVSLKIRQRLPHPSLFPGVEHQSYAEAGWDQKPLNSDRFQILDNHHFGESGLGSQNHRSLGGVAFGSDFCVRESK